MFLKRVLSQYACHVGNQIRPRKRVHASSSRVYFGSKSRSSRDKRDAPQEEDLYARLGVDRYVTDKELTAAYRKLALKYVVDSYSALSSTTHALTQPWFQ